MNTTESIWVLTKITTNKEEPACLNTFAFKNEETAKENFLNLFSSWESDNAQFKEDYTEYETVNTQTYIYRHYINDDGGEIIFSLEKFEFKL